MLSSSSTLIPGLHEPKVNSRFGPPPPHPDTTGPGVLGGPYSGPIGMPLDTFWAPFESFESLHGVLFERGLQGMWG